ncbi:hypothetical protein PVK06_021492 [Gossypium arboreum]|uniref:Phorbol-ester/DAG-type domain-containing protein n=1 Tax=Gossypium arboreum TaxID=29729 RepID=A0ABR0PQ47_GOSAR|nr:hypothetical protein PVK06_021492 [Gossypium arboreum]
MDNENECHHKSVQQIQHPFHKEHPLVLLTEESDEALKAYCDGCGELLSAPCFTCIHCNYHIHKQCVEAPFSLPNHPLHPKHSSSGIFIRKRPLFIRKRPHYDNDLVYGCVLCKEKQDDRLYEVIEEEKQCEELYEKSIQSSITHVIEVNEAGEATKIEHFSHQHCLVLADKMEEEINRKCDGGFFYNIGGAWDMCIRCAKVADIIKCEGHQHFLFYDFKCNEKCNGCGTDNDIGAFRCGKCKFTLGFGCLTLPHSALHKIDQHMLNLTYHDDREQSYCDICEQERDPRFWYYSCSNCDTSAHTECVLGQFPFLKDGSTFSHYDHKHRHDLEFFRKAEGYPRCSYCGKLCQEEILKCEKSTCNYIVHCKCRNYQV